MPWVPLRAQTEIQGGQCVSPRHERILHGMQQPLDEKEKSTQVILWRIEHHRTLDGIKRDLRLQWCPEVTRGHAVQTVQLGTESLEQTFSGKAN